MRIDGAIYPTNTQSRFDRDAWCQQIASRGEFRQYPFRQIRNPFNGEIVTMPPCPDAAEIVVDREVVGQAYWSMSEEPLVIVSVEQSAIPVVQEWAAALGGEFRLDL